MIRADAKTKVKRFFSGKSQDDAVAALVEFGEKFGAKKQLDLLYVITQIAVDNGRAVGGRVGLGDIILREQIEKVTRYGERAYCLSEKQIGVVVRENYPWIAD
jgi:hypothetical protein